MKKSTIVLVCFFVCCCVCGNVTAKNILKDKAEFYRITVYHFATKEQEQSLDEYLEKAMLPALHRNKFEQIGVFKPLANDTAVDKKVYVYVNAKTLEAVADADNILNRDTEYKSAAASFLALPFDKPFYKRYETILLKAFRMATKMNLPALTSPKTDHVYELRSYESSTDGLYLNKVQMFNEGGEVTLFKDLNFNAVFYADVISGANMPNLMYMTCFENIADRDAHWKSFSDSPVWKKLSGLPEYQHNVSHADIILMHPTTYSDF